MSFALGQLVYQKWWCILHQVRAHTQHTKRTPRYKKFTVLIRLLKAIWLFGTVNKIILNHTKRYLTHKSAVRTYVKRNLMRFNMTSNHIEAHTNTPDPARRHACMHFNMTPRYVFFHKITGCYHSAALSCFVLSMRGYHILQIFNELLATTLSFVAMCLL